LFLHFLAINLLFDIIIYLSRTLTWVYDAILDDLVFPAEIVGKRIRVKLDGKQVMKVHLDKTQQTNIEHKVIFTIQYIKYIPTFLKLTNQLYMHLINYYHLIIVA